MLLYRTAMAWQHAARPGRAWRAQTPDQRAKQETSAGGQAGRRERELGARQWGMLGTGIVKGRGRSQHGAVDDAPA